MIFLIKFSPRKALQCPSRVSNRESLAGGWHGVFLLCYLGGRRRRMPLDYLDSLLGISRVLGSL